MIDDKRQHRVTGVAAFSFVYVKIPEPVDRSGICDGKRVIQTTERLFRGDRRTR